MKRRPLVSIITVCYNSEKYIRSTIESVLLQTYKNIEYIIIDGESTDRTLDIIKDYESKFNGRMKWISENDDGIYDAMNKGINLAKGELIGIINSDDWYHYNSLEVLTNNYEEKVDIYYGNLYQVREIENKLYIKKINGNKLHLIKKSVRIQHPSCFVNKRWYKKIKYDTKYKIAADYKFILHSFIKGAKFKYIDFSFSFMRMGGLSSINLEKNLITGMNIQCEILGKKYFIISIMIFFISLLKCNFYKIRKQIAMLFLPKKVINLLKKRGSWKPFNEQYNKEKT